MMKKILLIGYSSLVKRKIIETLVKNNIPYDVASRSRKQKDFNAENWYYGYEKALNNSNADIAYISLPNSLHFYWAKKALQKNYHTLIDKPATINLEDLNKLITISKKRKKILSEAIFFNYHNQIKYISKQININKISKLNANFSIPKPSKGSILLSKKLKGGVIMDMGPYIAAVSRLFFKLTPKKIIKNVEFKNNLSSKINIIFIYKNTYFIGKFSHNNEYKNFIEVYFKNKIIKLNRVFSPPTQENLKVLELKKNKIKTKIFSDNSFENYLREIFILIKKKKYNHFYKQMTQDIKIRENLQF